MKITGINIDRIFKQMEDNHNKYLTDTFICSRCKEKKSLYHSVILPQRASNKLIRVCDQCRWKIFDELKGDEK